MGGRLGRAIAAVCVAAWVAGCATPAPPEEDKLDENSYLVTVHGGFGSPREVNLKRFLYRCAETTLAHGYAYFELYAPARRTTQKPGWNGSAIVRMYPKNIMVYSGSLFDARDVAAALGPELRSGHPGTYIPPRFRRVAGKFPVLPVKHADQEQAPSAPASGGPVKLEDLKGLMPQ